MITSSQQLTADQASDTNREFYDRLWSKVRWPPPERFNTWDFVQELLAGNPRRLEVGPGMRPRLPVEGTDFVDLSERCIERLSAAGGRALCTSVANLPYADDIFPVVCAFDIVEHVTDDERVLQELVRVLAHDGALVVSVPLYQDRWTPFDTMCGHVRRYEPTQFRDHLVSLGLTIERSCGFGMQPRQWLVDLGMWFMRVMPRRAMFFFNYIFMPIGLKLQDELKWATGDAALLNPAHDTVLMVCRKNAT